MIDQSCSLGCGVGEEEEIMHVSEMSLGKTSLARKGETPRHLRGRKKKRQCTLLDLGGLCELHVVETL